MTTYTHLTNSAKLDNRKYEQEDSLKPHGLWCSIGDQWKEQLGRMGWDVPNKRFNITLKDDANILTVTSDNARDVMREYRVKPERSEFSILPVFSWKAVAEKYDGVVFLIPDRNHVLLYGFHSKDKKDGYYQGDVDSLMLGMDIEVSLVVWNLDMIEKLTTN